MAASAVLVAAGCEKHKSVTVRYEIDREKLVQETPTATDHERLLDSAVTTMQNRLGANGAVRLMGDGSLEVNLRVDEQQTKLAALKLQASAQGYFEFRVMANSKVEANRDVIALAQKLPKDEHEVVADDRVLAKWVKCRDPKMGSANLLVERGEGEAVEVLAMIDELHVTGVYLLSAEKRAAEGPGPAGLAFTLNARGGGLMKKLTSEHLPTASGERRALGVILDDELLAAPSLLAVISAKGVIEGMSEADVDALISIFNEGALPLPLREVPAQAGP